MTPLLLASLLATAAPDADPIEKAVHDYFGGAPLLAAQGGGELGGAAWIYLWAASIEAEGPDVSGGGGGPTYEANSDIFEELQGAFMFHAVLREDKWSLDFDLLYLDVDGDLSGPGGLITGDSSTSGWLVDLYLAYEVFATRDDEGRGIVVEPFLGVSFIEIDFELAFPSASGDLLYNSWDPIVGADVTASFSDHWAIYFRGILGGFGLSDTNLRIDLLGGVIWSPTDNFSLLLGWRWLDLDADSGLGSDISLTINGPILALGYRF